MREGRSLPESFICNGELRFVLEGRRRGDEAEREAGDEAGL